MESIQNAQVYVQHKLNAVLQNPYVMAILKVGLVLYASRIAPRLPSAVQDTFANTFVGTTGSVSQTSGVISFSSNNGVTIVATSANNLAVSTSQDLRTSASPTFSGLSLNLLFIKFEAALIYSF